MPLPAGCQACLLTAGLPCSPGVQKALTVEHHLLVHLLEQERLPAHLCRLLPHQHVT